MKVLAKIFILFIFSMFIYVPTVFTQPETLWTKTFGGNGWESGSSVQETEDRGFIITGTANSFGAGNDDVWLIKTDSLGNKIWSQTFGGSNYESGSIIEQTTDGGYIIIGRTRSFGAGKEDVFLIKTDTQGNEQWSKTFGGWNTDFGTSVDQTSDHGYIITGWTKSFGAGDDDVWLIKTDSSGNEVWNKTFGGSKSDNGESVLQAIDGGYIITGTTASYGSGDNDVWLIKTDSSGNEVWSQTFGGKENDGSHCIQQTSDGGYIVTGWTHSFDVGDGDTWLIKTDAVGNKEWSKTFGGSGHDDCWCVQQTGDEGYILTGYTRSFGAVDWDVLVIKTDVLGNKVWIKTFGGNNIDSGYSVQQIADGGYIITGNTNSHTGSSNFDVWLIRLGPEATSIDQEIINISHGFVLNQNYPNPFNTKTIIAYELFVNAQIEMSIFNLLSERVKTLTDDFQSRGIYSLIWDGKHDNGQQVSSGTYYYRLKADDIVLTRRMILIQ
jgi:hypothetical protein